MKSFIHSIDHVQICIPEGEEQGARAFYSDVLKLNEIEKPDALKINGGLWYQVAQLQLHIGTEPPSVQKSKRHVAFEVLNIEEVRTYLEKMHVPIKEDIPIPGGVTFFNCRSFQ